jgi:NADPH-dependent 2,4-dienoyl-CoA reductase/sulfur reductase-like enzyme
MNMNRRAFLKFTSAALGVGGLAGCAAPTPVGQARPQVVVVGAGFGGATFARHLKRWTPEAEITLIEPLAKFISCPFSNTVLAGTNRLEDLTFPYDNLKRVVDHWVADSVTAIDPVKRKVSTVGGHSFSYDRLVLAGGVELRFDRVLGYHAEAQKTVKHAWKASADQTVILRRQLEAMPDGGVFVMASPAAPYRCPPAPYERVCQVATYFKQAKPRSKIILLDANPDIVSKKPLFLATWNKHYGYGSPDSMIDYRPNHLVRSLDAKRNIVSSEFDDVHGDVLNVVPPMRAANICALAGARGAGEWCAVDYASFESKTVPHIHILGDSAQTPYPKSGSVANNTGKMCAYALGELFAGRQPDPSPVVTNTCYSAASESMAFHVATVFRWDPEAREMRPQPGANGMSKAESELEMAYMESWARNVWADTLGLPSDYNFTAKG